MSPPPPPLATPRVADPPRVSLATAVAHPEKVGHLDGVPHDIVGFLAYAVVALAGLTAVAYLLGGPTVALSIGLVAGALVILRLVRRARRERIVEAVAADHDRP